MTVIAWGLLLVVLLTQAFLAALLVRENRRLQVAQSVHERLVSIVASVAGLRKEHLNLAEMVETWRARDVSRGVKDRHKNRGKVPPDEEEQPGGDEQLPDDVFFPTIASRSK
jgi:hypothetical protein